MVVHGELMLVNDVVNDVVNGGWLMMIGSSLADGWVIVVDGMKHLFLGDLMG